MINSNTHGADFSAFMEHQKCLTKTIFVSCSLTLSESPFVFWIYTRCCRWFLQVSWPTVSLHLSICSVVTAWEPLVRVKEIWWAHSISFHILESMGPKFVKFQGPVKFSQSREFLVLTNFQGDLLIYKSSLKSLKTPRVHKHSIRASLWDKILWSVQLVKQTFRGNSVQVTSTSTTQVQHCCAWCDIFPQLVKPHSFLYEIDEPLAALAPVAFF